MQLHGGSAARRSIQLQTRPSAKQPDLQTVDARSRPENASRFVERTQTDQIVFDALPLLSAADRDYQQRLQRALLDARAGADSTPEHRLRVAFDLYAEELLTRGELCAFFDLDLWQFMDYQARFAADHDQQSQ
jgi:hypothetical protein